MRECKINSEGFVRADNGARWDVDAVAMETDVISVDCIWSFYAWSTELTHITLPFILSVPSSDDITDAAAAAVDANDNLIGHIFHICYMPELISRKLCCYKSQLGITVGAYLSQSKDKIVSLRKKFFRHQNCNGDDVANRVASCQRCYLQKASNAL